ncbi:MAG TPA: hypothetical protein VIJ92_14920 [Ginsengibacter sp.]
MQRILIKILISTFLLFIGIMIGKPSFGQTEKNKGEVDAQIDFSNIIGKIKPLHGVNQGPFDYMPEAAPIEVYFKKAGFPSVRLHDVNWPHPDAVDIHTIFPLFDEDPDDPKNYTFKKTDDYLLPIIKNNSEIIYRLGESIEQRASYYTHPPKDFKKWAKICVNIIRHYNDGWANGFHYNIKYWEIWNEPEGKSMWTGPVERYFKLYEITAKDIKEYDSTLQVGGPAASRIYHYDLVKPFLAYCKAKSLPLDFFSFHLYTDSLQKMANNVRLARSIVDDYGFKNTKIFLDEWHYRDLPWSLLMPGLRIPGSEDYDLYKYKGVGDRQAQQSGQRGASFSASALMLMQDYPIDVMNFYEADYGNMLSMFDYHGIPKPTYYALYAFNQLYNMKNRVYSSYDNNEHINDGLMLLAGVSDDKKEGVILLSNFSKSTEPFTISIKGFSDSDKIQYKVYLLNDYHDLELVKLDGLKVESSNDLKFNMLFPYSVYLIKLIRQ